MPFPPNQESNKNNPEGLILLGVNIHCEGCANEVHKHLRGFQGVEGIEIDAKNNKVKVKGKQADPMKVAERLRRKSGKHVELISPKPLKEDKKMEDKKPEAEVVEVMLKVYLHCESCAKEVRHCILKMEGVQTVDAEMEKNLVRVKGIMAPQKLVEFINKRGGRHAEIVKPSNKADEKKADCGGGGCCCRRHDCDRLLYAPQLFSDENPNACSLM